MTLLPRTTSGFDRQAAVSAPSTIRTHRLLLRKPAAGDEAEIFERYAGNPDVCRYLAWPMHNSIEDARAFIDFSESEWARWPAGPFLICSLAEGSLLGGTGLRFEKPHRASTGYVLARHAWGWGFATEAVLAMRRVAADLAVTRLFAHCHPDHRASRRVLKKAGFELEGRLRQHSEFPNLQPGVVQDVLCYSCVPAG